MKELPQSADVLLRPPTIEVQLLVTLIVLLLPPPIKLDIPTAQLF